MLPSSEETPWDLAMVQHQGDRERQEDATGFRLSSDPQCCLLVVADGLGGHRGGREAALGAVEAMTWSWEQNPGVDERLFRACIEQAGTRIARVSADHGGEARTTFVALAFDCHTACWSHLGDSRLYLFRLGDTIRRTKDHSVARLMVEMGEMTEAEASKGPEQGRLYKSLGPEGAQNYRIETTALTPDDAFLLCTDGFWTKLSEPEMASALSAEDLEQALAGLAALAVERSAGESDNVTACAARPKAFTLRRGSRDLENLA